MRWSLLLLVCAGCPEAASVGPDELTDPEDVPPDIVELPPSNCARGEAPPITWCRERRTGYSEGSASRSRQGSIIVDDWTNITNNGAGHTETIYGDGFPIESHSTGTFAGGMTTVCSDQGRVSIQHAYYAVIRQYFDTANRVQSFEWDAEHDGVFESRYFYSYDARGNLIRQEHDTGPGTPIDAIAAYEYDGRDRMLVSTSDTGADGNIDFTVLHTWDDGDHEIEQSQLDEHGEPVGRWTWTYDGDLLLVTEVSGFDAYRWTNMYNERRRLSSTEYFDVANETLDAISRQTYDELDRPLAFLEDDGVDGTTDLRVEWDYCP
jgi:hypothetical protein